MPHRWEIYSNPLSPSESLFAHVRRSLYTDGVKDFKQKFGQSNVKVILFEQFRNATQAVVQSVFEFLALSQMKVDVSEI